MKEATGELNLGLITIIAIGVMAAFFYMIIWPQLKGNFQKNTSCDKAVCKKEPIVDGMVECVLYDKNGNPQETLKCVYKG